MSYKNFINDEVKFDEKDANFITKFTRMALVLDDPANMLAIARSHQNSHLALCEEVEPNVAATPGVHHSDELSCAHWEGTRQSRTLLISRIPGRYAEFRKAGIRPFLA